MFCIYCANGYALVHTHILFHLLVTRPHGIFYTKRTLLNTGKRYLLFLKCKLYDFWIGILHFNDYYSINHITIRLHMARIYLPIEHKNSITKFKEFISRFEDDVIILYFLRMTIWLIQHYVQNRKSSLSQFTLHLIHMNTTHGGKICKLKHLLYILAVSRPTQARVLIMERRELQ